LFLKVEGSELILGNFQVPRWEKAEKLVKFISKVSEECIDPEKLCSSNDVAIQAIGNFFKVYITLLNEENALDFSAIQSEMLWLIEHKPEVLSALHDKIAYFMIDEYQDTNTIQERILLLLSRKYNNICVVGDDDQGLYRFRGATIRNILEFPDNFTKPKCKKVTLTVNYRSHPDIINFYNNFMNGCEWTENKTTFRYPKIIEPRNAKFISNPAVIKVSATGDYAVYFDQVLNFIRHLEDKQVLTDYNQIAFLFKSVKNEHVIELANFLENNNIAVFSPRSALFFEREEIRLLLGAYISLFPDVFNTLKWNESAHLQVWDFYRECEDLFLSEIKKDPKKHETLLKWCMRRAKQHATLTSNTNYAFAALLYQMLEFPMFSNYLQTDLKGKKTTLRAAYNIALLSKLLYKFEYTYNITILKTKDLQKVLQNLFNQFLRFLIDGGIEEYEDFDEYAPSGCVSFMTIHQSKGLEFPVVFVGSLNAVPIKQYDDIDIVLQKQYYSRPPFEPIERTKTFDFYRLFYTAFSRAQNLLVLTAHEHKGHGQTPSKYFTDVYKAVVDCNDESFNIELLKLKDVKPVNIKHEYSFTSHILLYEDCPLQYKYYKELEFVEVRTGGVLGGSLLHQTIEDIHKAVLRKETHLLTDENITNWFNNNYFLLSKQQRAYLHESQQLSLLKQVLRYRDRNTDRWHLIKEAEVDVSLVKEDFILKGTIDLIEGENNTVELIDFKSGDKPDVNSNDEKTKSRLNQYRRQLEVYAHIIAQNKNLEVTKLHLYYPKEDSGNPFITFPVFKDNINATISIFAEVVNKIETKNYDMSHTVKNEKQCGDCDMRYHCNPKYYCN